MEQVDSRVAFRGGQGGLLIFLNATLDSNIYTNKAKRNLFVCLRVCPKWPAMSCMEWLPALGIQG